MSKPINQRISTPKIKHKVKNRCKLCQKPIKRNAEHCVNCYYKIRSQKSNRLPKTQLVDMLNRFTFVQVGEYCGVSDNAIKKWCVKYGISKYAKDYDTPIKQEIFRNKMKKIVSQQKSN